MRRRNPEEFEKAYASYAKYYDASRQDMLRAFPRLIAFYEGLPSAVKPKDAVPADTPAYFHSVEYLLAWGRDLVHKTLRHKVVPKNRVKAFEKAFRAFDYKRRPKNSVLWLARNLDSAKLLLDTKNWPDKGEAGQDIESGERVFKLGPFTIHDQTSGDIRATTQVLVRAEELMRASNIGRIEQVIYGNVYFVGSIERKKTVHAKYYPTQDIIALLVIKKFEARELFSLIHEFGHRYYGKELTPQKRNEWNHYDHQLRRQSQAPVKLPAVGDVLPEINNRRVAGYDSQSDRPRGKTFIILEGGGFIETEAYVRFMQKVATQAALPTPYSRTNAEEHFCETFALYVEGKLPEKFVAPFQQVVGVSRAANRGRSKRATSRLMR